VLTGSLFRLGVRQLSSHPWQLILAIVGIALGVALAVSIDLANGSALRAFTLATESAAGRLTRWWVDRPDCPRTSIAA
jgi:putative ABC transport system permease protein